MFISLVIVSAFLAAQDAPTATNPLGQVTPPLTSPQATADITPPNRAAAPTPERKQMVCENRALTGRRLQQRICYTPEQYAEMIAIKRKQAEEMVAGSHVQDDRAALGGDGPL